MGCNNDLRKERQLMDKPTKEKIEAGKMFKIYPKMKPKKIIMIIMLIKKK